MVVQMFWQEVCFSQENEITAIKYVLTLPDKHQKQNRKIMKIFLKRKKGETKEVQSCCV